MHFMGQEFNGVKISPQLNSPAEFNGAGGINLFLTKLLSCGFQCIGLVLSIPLAPFDNLKAFSYIAAGDLHRYTLAIC